MEALGRSGGSSERAQQGVTPLRGKEPTARGPEPGYLDPPREAWKCWPPSASTATEFVTEAIHNELLVIPGNTFSRRDTHFRISYAAPDETLGRGIEILNRLAKKG